MNWLIAICFGLITIFALRRGPVGALGIFFLYMWVGVLIPYLWPSPFGVPLEEYAIDMASPSVDTAMLIILVFMFFVSLSDRNITQTQGFERKYFTGQSQTVCNRFSMIAIACALLFIGGIILASGSLSNAANMFYQRVIISDSLFNFTFIFLSFALSFSIFAFRFRRKMTPLLWAALISCAFCALLSGGRSITILYVVSLFYPDLARMRFLKLLAMSFAGLLAIALISSAMLAMRYEAQAGGTVRSEQGSLASGVTGLVAVDDVAIAVEYVEQYGHSFTKVYAPIIALPIPRTLWPGKPIQISREMRGFLYGDTDGGMPPGIVGESYIAGGALLVAVVGLLFGFMLNFVDRITRLSAYRSFPAAEAVAGVMGPTVAFILFRGGLDIGLLRLSVPFVVCLIALRLVRNFKVRAEMAAVAASVRKARAQRRGLS